jgi:hypothetical protein
VNWSLIFRLLCLLHDMIFLLANVRLVIIPRRTTVYGPPTCAIMAPKRPREDEDTTVESKKPRTGFKVGPDNLPDGTWKRKGMGPQSSFYASKACILNIWQSSKSRRT